MDLVSPATFDRIVSVLIALVEDKLKRTLAKQSSWPHIEMPETTDTVPTGSATIPGLATSDFDGDHIVTMYDSMGQPVGQSLPFHIVGNSPDPTPYSIPSTSNIAPGQYTLVITRVDPTGYNVTPGTIRIGVGP